MQMSFQTEQNLPKKRMNCLVSKCETYHAISDIIAVTINSTIQNWAPSNWERPRKAQHLQFCSFVHSAYKWVIIELMQQWQEMNLAQMTTTYEIILKKRQLSCKGIARDLRIYGGLIVDLMLWRSLFVAGVVFWFMFFRDCESFSLLFGSQHPLS